MELVSTIEISGDEREIADAYAREQIDSINNNLDGLGYGENGAKNLFEDENKWIENIPIIRGTKSVSNGKITLTATDNDCFTSHYKADWRNNGIKTIPCKPNTTYTLSWEYEGNSEGYVYIFENGSANNMKYDRNTVGKLILITSADAEFLIFRIGVFGQGTSMTYWNFQIEEGNTSTPYKPYIPSVKMLAEEVNAQNESLSVIGKCKNLLNPSHLGTTVMGITCTNNGDGTYALNGTATADLDLCIKGFKNLQLNKEYKMLGCPSGGSDSTYMLYDSSESDIKDIGKGKVYTPTKQPNINIRIMNGVTVNNLVFKPMLTTNLSATYDDFVPYTGDGETLTADVAELKNDLSDSLPVGTILTVVSDTPMSSDMWRFLNTGKMTYQNGGALVEMGTMIYQKIK